MSILRELYEDVSMGATSACNVAAYAEPLMAKPIKRQKIGKMLPTKKRVKKRTVVREGMNDGDFDPQDVLSKLDAAETKSKHQEDTVTFGLTDENNNVIRVVVDGEQAKDFELELSKMLSAQFDDTIENYTGTPAKEIAEILFVLKDRFNIVDVVWGEIPTDEDEEPEEPEMTADDQDADMSMGGEQTDQEVPQSSDGSDEKNPPEDLTDVSGPSSDMSSGDEKSLLQKVIDMMKTDAEARKAEASAREAEAKASVSKFASDAAMAKVKQEEDILDMEAYYKDKQSQDKEAKNLAKLAKYKHDIARDNGDDLQSSSEEEEHVTLQKLSDLIVQRLKGR